MTAEKQVRIDPEARQAMAVAIDMLLAVGATWEAIRIELFRQAVAEKAPWSQVPSRSSLERLLLEEFECDNMNEYNEKRGDTIKSQLKGKAVSMALNGHATMLIFCLKNLCGWSDNLPKEVDPEDAKNKITLAYGKERKA